MSAKSGHKGKKDSAFELLPWDSLWVVARLFGRGAMKYAPRNWERGYDWSASAGALQRHFARFWAGEDIDPELELPHLAAMCFHCLVLLAFWLRGVGNDDRPLDHAQSAMIEVVTNPEDIEKARQEALER